MVLRAYIPFPHKPFGDNASVIDFPQALPICTIHLLP